LYVNGLVLEVINELFRLGNRSKVVNFSLNNIEKQTIADASTNFIIVSGFAAYSFVFIRIKEINPIDFNFYPNYLYIYFHQLIYPGLMAGIITISYYIGHSPLRKTIAREAKNCLPLSN